MNFKINNMISVKLKNVSVKNGDKFRTNQNYTMSFSKKDGIDENSSVDTIRDLIVSKYNNRVLLNNTSQIIVVNPITKTIY